MITSRQHILLAGLLASAAFASSGAFAQAPATPAAPATVEAQAATPGVAKRQHMDPAQRMERMKAHRAMRLAALKDKLKLTPAQESAWSSFTSAQQPPARDPAQMRAQRAELAKMTTPERLDRMQARQTERSAMFAKRADATRSFYAALSPEQQKTFDAESMRFGHGGHGPHHGRHGQGDTPTGKS